MEEIHADPMDSPLTKMLEGVLGTLDHHGDFDVEIHTDSEGQTLNYSMMNHPIVSAHYAGKVITDVNPGSQTCQEIEDSPTRLYRLSKTGCPRSQRQTPKPGGIRGQFTGLCRLPGPSIKRKNVWLPKVNRHENNKLL